MKEYIDLGLPSGTLWCTENEENYYTYDEAVEEFGDNLPTKEQWEELKNECVLEWDKDKKGYNVIGLNGNSIFLPANGFVKSFSKNEIYEVGFGGNYLCSTSSILRYVWCLEFNPYSIIIYDTSTVRNCGMSVRLIKNK